VVCAQPGVYANVHEVASAASGAKKMAKREAGCSCFLERRLPPARTIPSPA